MRQLLTAALMIGIGLLVTAILSAGLQQWAMRKAEQRDMEYVPEPIEKQQPYRRNPNAPSAGPPSGGTLRGQQIPSAGRRDDGPGRPTTTQGTNPPNPGSGAEYQPPGAAGPSFKLGSPYRTDQPKQQPMRPTTPTLRPATDPPERRL